MTKLQQSERQEAINELRETLKPGTNGHHDYPVCSEQCATGQWIHSDGGYALKHRWM